MKAPTAGFRQFDKDFDFPPPAPGTPRIDFQICSSMRSGSHYLGHLMYSTGALGYPLEYFHPPNFNRWQEMSGQEDVFAVVEYMRSRRTSPNGVFGNKMHFANLVEAMQVYPIDELFPDRKHILLERLDALDQAISLVRAKQSGQFISLREAVRPTHYDYDAIAAGIRYSLENQASWRSYFARTGTVAKLVTYESLLDNPQEAIQDIATWLGVGAVTIDPARVLPQRQANAESREWRERFLSDPRTREGSLLPITLA